MCICTKEQCPIQLFILSHYFLNVPLSSSCAGFSLLHSTKQQGSILCFCYGNNNTKLKLYDKSSIWKNTPTFYVVHGPGVGMLTSFVYEVLFNKIRKRLHTSVTMRQPSDHRNRLLCLLNQPAQVISCTPPLFLHCSQTQALFHLVKCCLDLFSFHHSYVYTHIKLPQTRWIPVCHS